MTRGGLEPAVGFGRRELKPDHRAVRVCGPYSLHAPAHARAPLGFEAEVAVLAEQVHQLALGTVEIPAAPRQVRRYFAWELAPVAQWRLVEPQHRVLTRDLNVIR